MKVCNSVLDFVFGKIWNIRVKNMLGDFSSVFDGTVEFWLLVRQPISDYFPCGSKFFPYKIEQSPVFVFTFVRQA